MMNFNNISLFLIFVLLVVSCNDDNDLSKLRENELNLLEQYIKKNNITVKPTNSGLYYIEKVQGSGDTVKVYDKVHVYYRTWLIDSTLVDANIDSLGRYYDPLSFTVVPVGATSTVVDGLNEGVQFMQKGTVATLIIPSEIGYGQSTTSGLPAFSTLIMEIRVDRIYKASTSGTN